MINKALLPIKGHYFMWNAGTAIISFLPVYAKQLGLSSAAVGLIYTIALPPSALAKYLFGAIADKFHCRKLIFLFFQILMACAIFALIVVHKVDNSRYIRFECDHTGSRVGFCYVLDDISDATCDVTCPLDVETRALKSTLSWNTSYHAKFSLNPTNVTKCLQQPLVNLTKKTTMCSRTDIVCDVQCKSEVIFKENSTDTFKDASNSFQFWFLMCLYLMISVSISVTNSAADTFCLQLLGDQPHNCGKQRMYGALGWGIFSIINGLILSAVSRNATHQNFAPIFIIAIIIILLGTIVSYQVQYNYQTEKTPNITSDMLKLFKNPRVFIFILCCIFVGMCTALVWNFLFWYLEELGAAYGGDVQSQIKTIEGAAMGIQCLLAEVPFFFLSSWILNAIGHINAMNLALFTIGVRYILYSVIKNPWWALPIALLNGPTFGLFYATMISYASIVSPLGTETTTQGLVCGFFEGVGVSLGSLLGGLSFDHFGGSATYLIAGLAAIAVCILHAAANYFISKMEASIM